jgi:hypothetical protein
MTAVGRSHLVWVCAALAVCTAWAGIGLLLTGFYVMGGVLVAVGGVLFMTFGIAVLRRIGEVRRR